MYSFDKGTGYRLAGEELSFDFRYYHHKLITINNVA